MNIDKLEFERMIENLKLIKYKNLTDDELIRLWVVSTELHKECVKHMKLRKLEVLNDK